MLTTKAVMGSDCLTVQKAWDIFDRWMEDPKVELRQDSPDADDLFRRATVPFAQRAAPKALADCYLLGLAQACGSQLVTLDAGLADLAEKSHYPVVFLD